MTVWSVLLLVGIFVCLVLGAAWVFVELAGWAYVLAGGSASDWARHRPRWFGLRPSAAERDRM